MNMDENKEPSLIRGLGVWDASSVVVGCIIGAGIFRLSSAVARESGSPFIFFAAWGLAGFLSLCGALTGGGDLSIDGQNEQSSARRAAGRARLRGKV